MPTPEFEDGWDTKTFFPVALVDGREQEESEEEDEGDVRLSFSEWSWLHARTGGDTVYGYYLNGYGVEGVLKACLLNAGIDPHEGATHFNSEGGACYVHFGTLEEAVRAASLLSVTLQDREKLGAMIAVARANKFGD